MAEEAKIADELRAEVLQIHAKLNGTPGVIPTPVPLMDPPGEMGYLIDAFAIVLARHLNQLGITHPT